MELNKSGMIPIVGNTYLLNFAELCGYSIALEGHYGFTLSDLSDSSEISKGAENYISECYSTHSSTVEEPHLEAPYQYRFSPEKLENQSNVYTMVKYIGAGCFVDLITNNFITMYDIFAPDDNMEWLRSGIKLEDATGIQAVADGVKEVAAAFADAEEVATALGVKLDDFKGIEQVNYLQPYDFKDFKVRYNTLLKSPLAINSEFDGLETIDRDNLSNLINCDVQKICEIESKLIEQARQRLQSQYNKIINIDHAIALEETKLMEETGLKIK